MSKHIETLSSLTNELQRFRHSAPVVIHCLDAVYPVVDVHIMPDGAIGIEIAMHEAGEVCNCGPTRTLTLDEYMAEHGKDARGPDVEAITPEHKQTDTNRD